MSSTNQKCPRTRLYVTQPFSKATDIVLDDKQSHYLSNVLRQKSGDSVVVFNGEDGEWLADIVTASKKTTTLTLHKRLREQAASPDVWLLAAPLKNGKTETVVEQATELGISHFVPVATQFTVIDRINHNRLTSIAIEASEQCERMEIPHIESLTPFAKLFANWDPKRKIIYGDESGAGKEPKELFSSLTHGKYAVLIGPEGGFSTSELASLHKIDYAHGMCMGPRILRAGTAAIAALTIVQSWLGDWENKPAFRQN